jgi:hypothetical protein
MQLTVRFTDVYDGREWPRTETLDVPGPPPSDEDLEEWAEENLYPLTGDGRAHDVSGYFAEILTSPEQPHLVGREFSWGV